MEKMEIIWREKMIHVDAGNNKYLYDLSGKRVWRKKGRGR